MGDFKSIINKHGYIRYSNCWEDPDILLEGLSPKVGDKILSIGSGGDNSFALLSTNPEIVVAADINPRQLQLIELKKLAIKKLDHKEVLEFLGFNSFEKRIHFYSLLKKELSFETRTFWDKHLSIIQNGIILHGKFEKYLRVFSRFILPLIHSERSINKLLSSKTESQQENFYDFFWNTWRWKSLFRIFFSKSILGKYGRDPELMKEVDVSVSEFIYGQTGKHLKTKQAQNNFILNFCLLGNFGSFLPFYLRKENFDVIKINIDRLILHEGFVESSIVRFGKFRSMNLSNIFEYMDENSFKKTSKTLINGMESNGKFGYWNLMVPRRISLYFENEVKYEEEISLVLSQKDKGFFYDKFILESIL